MLNCALKECGNIERNIRMILDLQQIRAIPHRNDVLISVSFDYTKECHMDTLKTFRERLRLLKHLKEINAPKTLIKKQQRLLLQSCNEVGQEIFKKELEEV